jgi:sialic acid synthase SpsE
MTDHTKMTLGSRAIGPGEPVYIIAELACAHEGDEAFAADTIRAAAGAGADAVKFQVFSADGLVVPTHALHANYIKFQFTLDAWSRLADVARGVGLDVWVDVFEPWSLIVADAIGAIGLKVHSTNVTNPFFLADVAQAGLPVIIGAGGTTRDEIVRAMDVLAAGDVPLAIVHGFQGFPTPIADTHLRRMTALATDFGVPVGFAGHEAGVGPGQALQNILAVGLGATFLENHITIDPSPERTDYASSLLPEAFATMVAAVREAEVTLGDAGYEFGEKEAGYRKGFKAFTVAAADLPVGHVLSREDLAFKRADDGLLPTDAAGIIGQSLSRALVKDQPITKDVIA